MNIYQWTGEQYAALISCMYILKIKIVLILIIMKNRIIITVICACCTITTFGQAEDEREKFQIGVKAGINVSNIYDTKGDNYTADPKVGFVGGGFLAIPIGKYLGVQPEVLYSQKGIRQSGSFLGIDYTMERTLGFLDIPIYLQLKPVPQLTLLFGPQYCFLLHSRDKFTAGTYTNDQQQDFKNDNIRKNIFGVATGFDINLSKFVIGARGAWDLQNNKGDGTSSNPRYKNVWFQLTAGFKF